MLFLLKHSCLISLLLTYYYDCDAHAGFSFLTCLVSKIIQQPIFILFAFLALFYLPKMSWNNITNKPVCEQYYTDLLTGFSDQLVVFNICMRVGLTALTMAEYFRDLNEQDVLLFIDNIFCFVQAGSEASTLLGRMPSAVGYQFTPSTKMGSLQKIITSTKSGSITLIEAVYVLTEDLADSVPAKKFAHLDSTTILSRGLAAKSIYLAVDHLDSTSTMLQPQIVGEEYYETGQRVKTNFTAV